MTREGKPEGITVNGEGRVTAAPDTLNLGIGIDVERDSVAQASRDAAQLAANLIETLKAHHVEEADIQTSHYAIHPMYDRHHDNRRLIGYRVSNAVQVKIRDLDRAGTVIDAAIAAGGNQVVVNGIGFIIEETEDLASQARRIAWGDALTKAQQLADLAGVTLGEATTITESFSPPIPAQRYETRLAMAEGGAAVTPLQPGELEVSTGIEVTFGIG